jgi:hypothetical protein
VPLAVLNPLMVAILWALDVSLVRSASLGNGLIDAIVAAMLKAACEE